MTPPVLLIPIFTTKSPVRTKYYNRLLCKLRLPAPHLHSVTLEYYCQSSQTTARNIHFDQLVEGSWL